MTWFTLRAWAFVLDSAEANRDVADLCAAHLVETEVR